MKVRSPRSLAVAVLPALAAFLVLQACGGGGNAVAQEVTADPMEGVWESVITARDCTTSMPTGTFIGAQVYHRGGTMSDTNASPTSSRGPGFGTWVKSGATYTVEFRFYAYGADGTVSGVTRVTRNVTLGSGSSGSATSVNTNQFFDLSGVLVRSTCATDVSVRVL